MVLTTEFDPLDARSHPTELNNLHAEQSESDI